MADRYLDHGVYTYAATPTWGVPQEGDGTGKDPATASATISIPMTGANFTSGSSTISVMGVTLTVNAGANSATNVQYAGTNDALVDNIVTVINTLMTGTIVNRPAGWYAHQVRDAIFARRNGSSLELMTRSGSASWNGLVAIAFTNVTGVSPASWAGGSGGCWGWFSNFSDRGTIWTSAWVLGSYSSLAQPLAGQALVADTCHIRAKNQELVFSGSTSPTTSIATNILLDNAGAVWGDSDNKTLTLVADGYLLWTLTTNLTTLGPLLVLAARKKGGLVFLTRGANSLTGIRFLAGFGSNRCIRFRNALFKDACTYVGGVFNATPCIYFVINSGASLSCIIDFATGCVYRCERSAVNSILLFQYSNSGSTHYIRAYDLALEFPAASGVQLGLFPVNDCWAVHLSNVTMSSPAQFNLVRRAVADSGSQTFQRISNVLADGIRGFNLSMATAVGNQGGKGASTAGCDTQFSVLTNAGTDSAFRLEGNTHTVDWLPGNQYPSLDCTTPLGTPWSWRWKWSGDVNFWNCKQTTQVLRLNARAPVSAAQSRTVTVELLVPPGITLTSELVSLRVSYEGPLGLVSYSTGTDASYGESAVNLPASAAAWSKTAYPTYQAVQLTLTTPSEVASGSDISVDVIASGPCPGGAADLFINPRVGVSA